MTTAEALEHCPRCYQRLITRYDERNCVSCGYTQDNPVAKKQRKPNPVTVMLPYVGGYADFKGKMLIGQFQRMPEGHTSPISAVSILFQCPTCAKEMDTRLSRETRPTYKVISCTDKHRVRLIKVKNNGYIGWRHSQEQPKLYRPRRKKAQQN